MELCSGDARIFLAVALDSKLTGNVCLYSAQSIKVLDSWIDILFYLRNLRDGDLKNPLSHFDLALAAPLSETV